MVLFLVLAAALSALSITLIATVESEGTRSVSAVRRDTAFHAAEAGLDDYIAKLVDDPLYYVHYLHPGESTRLAPDGTIVAPGAAWSFGATWTYPSGKNAWRSLNNGYEYNLQVTPPSATQQAIRIVATGRRAGSGNLSEMRAIDSLIRPSSVADFQMLANRDISYGSSATTYGKIYAGIDENGAAHSVWHDGTAYGDIYAEGSVNGSTTLMGGAQTYNSTTIRSVVKNPINFSSFLTSLVDIQRASSAGGVYLDNPSVDGWRLTFQSDGTFRVQSCTRNTGRDIADWAPVCGAVSARTVPSNGAIYAAQSVIVSGVVKGRVTVASNGNVVVCGDITYTSPGNDVLGLVARNDMYVAQWAPTNVSWRAATIAQSGIWRSWSSDGSHGTMTFTGSTATNLGGYMSMFNTRVYQYDQTLLYLPPPWFPTIGDAYTMLLFREVAP